MKKNRVLILLIIMIISMFSQVSAAQVDDIGGHWGQDDINYLLDKKIVQGHDGIYRPEDSITRAEFVTIINKATDNNKTGRVSFTDVKSGAWYYDDVRKAVGAGFISGFPDSTFKPEQPISRQDASKIARVAFGIKELDNSTKTFKDHSSIRSDAVCCVNALVTEGYINGFPDGTFKPKGNITRVEAATIVSRTIKGESSKKPAPSPHKVEVTGIEYIGDNQVEITSTGKLDYTDSFWNNSLILDIKDAKLSCDVKNIIPDDSNNIKAVRFSQYNNNPMTTRVIFDLTGNFSFSNSNDSTSTIITIEKDNTPVEPEKPEMPEIPTIVIDPGHGGSDSGATGNGLLEKDINLSVGLKIGKILENNDLNVIYTRKTDVYPTLSERTDIANNADADIFVSIHANAFNSKAYGYETYSYLTSTEGAVLAKDIHDSVISNKDLHNNDRGTRKGNFQVIRNTKMPAVLVELGFIDNAEDAKILVEKQDEFAEAISQGILKYLNN